MRFLKELYFWWGVAHFRPRAFRIAWRVASRMPSTDGACLMDTEVP